MTNLERKHVSYKNISSMFAWRPFRSTPTRALLSIIVPHHHSLLPFLASFPLLETEIDRFRCLYFQSMNVILTIFTVL